MGRDCMYSADDVLGFPPSFIITHILYPCSSKSFISLLISSPPFPSVRSSDWITSFHIMLSFVCHSLSSLFLSFILSLSSNAFSPPHFLFCVLSFLSISLLVFLSSLSARLCLHHSSSSSFSSLQYPHSPLSPPPCHPHPYHPGCVMRVSTGGKEGGRWYRRGTKGRGWHNRGIKGREEIGERRIKCNLLWEKWKGTRALLSNKSAPLLTLSLVYLGTI